MDATRDDRTDGAAPFGGAPDSSARRELPPLRRVDIFGRLVRLCLKEFREILRDRRTIFTLVGMPLLVYPLLSLVFNRFVLTTLVDGDRTPATILAFDGDAQAEEFWRTIAAGNLQLERLGEEVSDLEQVEWKADTTSEVDRKVTDGRVDLGVQMLGGSQTAPPRWRLTRLPGGDRGDMAERILTRRLEALNRRVVDGLLRRAGQPPFLPVEYDRLLLEPPKGSGLTLVAFIPLMLILMTITGAVYPAIDLTAGERERGTLEALIAAPIPRSGLLFAKYVTVVFVAMLTAVANLVAMSTTLMVGGLEKLVFGDQGLSLMVIGQIFGLLILFAAFFSAVLLAITSFARSFKEAQAYLIPLMLLTLAPGILTLAPDLSLAGPLAVTPLVNIALLARDLFAGNADPTWGLLVIASTTIYAAAALGIASSIFGTDAVLYGSSIGWRDYLRRPDESAATATPAAALTCLAVLFVAFFLSYGVMARFAAPGGAARGAIDPTPQLIVAASASAMIFLGIPGAMAIWLRLRWASAFGLRAAPLWSIPVGLPIALGMWTLAHELVLLSEWFGWVNIEAMSDRVRTLLTSWRSVSPLLIVVAFGIVPPIVEEFFFRGLLFRAIASRFGPWGAIVASSLAFGTFHVVSGLQLTPERFLPSTFAGLVLGIIAWRTASLFPGTFVHAIHNSGLLLLAYYQPQLQQWGFDVAEGKHLPATWLALGGGSVALALLMALRMKVPADDSPTSLSSATPRTTAEAV